MRVLFGVVFAAAMAVSVFSASAGAWGRDGHRIVCDLAYRHLSEDTRAEVDRLVALDPDYEHFREVCAWADRVRGSTHGYTAPWHYTNQDPADPVIDREDCAENGCVLSAIEHHAGVFADRTRSDEDRLEALKFLAHWVGDIHQPLHVSIAGDRGGNDVRLVWRDRRPSNLHRIWDSEILLDLMADTFPNTTESSRNQLMADQLAGEIPLAGSLVFTPLDPVAWAQESHDIVRSRSLAYYWEGTDRPSVADDDYYVRNIPIVRDQLKRGGVRLAGLLNTLVEERDLAASGPAVAAPTLE